MLEAPDLARAEHVLVNGAVFVAAGAALEEAEVPRGEEPAVADLAAHEDDHAVDEVAGVGVGVMAEETAEVEVADLGGKVGLEAAGVEARDRADAGLAAVRAAIRRTR